MTPKTATRKDAGDAHKRTLIDALHRKYDLALRLFLVRKRLNREEVADIVQETWCRVHQAGTVDTIRHPKAFLFRVANNLRLNSEKHRRHGVEDTVSDAGSLEVAAEEPGPYRHFQGEQEVAIVRASLEELPLKCRQAFVLNRFENMTFVQIAAELNLSVSMIEKHVSFAIAHMRKRLGEATCASRAPSSRTLSHDRR